jgi:hypothetical protein
MMQPNITHMPCDLNQQQKRHDARKDSGPSVAWRMGKRSWLDRLMRRGAPGLELSAVDLRPETEDAFHGFQV